MKTMVACDNSDHLIIPFVGRMGKLLAIYHAKLVFKQITRPNVDDSNV